MALKTDALKKGSKKAAVATNLFSQARSQLDHSNALLDAAIADDQAQIDELFERIDTAKSQKASNKKVSDKLADFIV